MAPIVPLESETHLEACGKFESYNMKSKCVIFQQLCFSAVFPVLPVGIYK